MRGKTPPTPSKISKILGITENDTLKKLQNMAAFDIQKFYQEYHSLVLVIDQTEEQIADAKWFKGIMKSVKEMVAEADEMEQEGE